MTKPGRFSFGKRGTFWSASIVLALSLWASGAPSVLYPMYAAQWSLPPIVTTSVFAVYPLALLVVLLFFGSLSDVIGRRRAILLGVGVIAVSAVVFAVAPNVGFLYLGRALQGIGTGFAIGAASAALVENNYFDNPRIASTLTTISTSTGLTLALLVSGVLAELAPLPLVLSFGVLLLLSALAFTLNFFTPHDETAGGRWTFTPPRIAPGITRVFIIATLGVALAYAVGAMFLSLGAQMAREFTGTTNLVVIGVVLGGSSLTIGATALFLSRVHSHAAIIIGGALTIVGLGFMAASSATGSIGWLLAWCIVGGVGYSFAFTGGIGMINRAAPTQHRGATLSMLYLFAYLLQALTAVGAGALATGVGLQEAVEIAAPVVGIVSVVAIILATIDLGSARRLAAGTA